MPGAAGEDIAGDVIADLWKRGKLARYEGRSTSEHGSEPSSSTRPERETVGRRVVPLSRRPRAWRGSRQNRPSRRTEPFDRASSQARPGRLLRRAAAPAVPLRAGPESRTHGPAFARSKAALRRRLEAYHGIGSEGPRIPRAGAIRGRRSRAGRGSISPRLRVRPRLPARDATRNDPGLSNGLRGEAMMNDDTTSSLPHEPDLNGLAAHFEGRCSDLKRERSDRASEPLPGLPRDRRGSWPGPVGDAARESRSLPEVDRIGGRLAVAAVLALRVAHDPTGGAGPEAPEPGSGSDGSRRNRNGRAAGGHEG